MSQTVSPSEFSVPLTINVQKTTCRNTGQSHFSQWRAGVAGICSAGAGIMIVKKGEL
jgi:hypothetical protein